MKSTKGSNDREFERNSRNRIYDRKKRDRIRMTFQDKNAENLKIKDKDKTKTYIAHEEYNNAFAFELNDSMNSDLQYFDLDYDEFYDSEETVETNHVMTLKVFCRRCSFSFSSNNLLHKHIRSKSCEVIFIKKLIKFSHKDFYEFAVYVSISKNSSTSTVQIIRSKIDFNTSIETEYDFRDWQYATAMISLNKNEKSDLECLDIEADIILDDVKYFQAKSKNIQIRTMISFITVRDLETNKHCIDKYAICSMYFSSTNKNDNKILTKIIKEIHLMNNLKTNLLIENDVLKPESIDIFTFTSSTFIKSCNVTISITMQIRSTSQIRLIHAIETSISANSEIAISIHKITILDRDYMFESKELINLSIYAHIIDSNTTTILIRNENDKSIRILRNFRLKNLIELDYSNVLQMSTKHSNLALRILKFTHKQCWFNKVINAISFCHINMIDVKSNMKTDIVHSLEITIHNSSLQIIETFINVVNEYIKLWTDKEFVKLSQKNWMRISLKIDWETKIKEKVKIYSLEEKNKIVVDNIFNKLHEQDRLFWTSKSTSFNFLCFVVWKDSLENRKDRVVIDIRALNAVSLSNAYFLSLQSEIIQAVHDCTFIFIVNCISFFYQWRVHSNDRHRLTVVTHKEQKTFNVVVMRYRNSLVYVQKQIDRILRFCRHFARAYIDDIVIFFKFMNEHISHLKYIFKFMLENNISINFVKTFLNFSFVTLLEQHVNSLSLSIDKEKIKTVANFTFSKTLSDFETYLDFIDWFRDYIEGYVRKFESFQERKTYLLKDSSKSENARKVYASKTKFAKFITEELNAFNEIQRHFVKTEFLIHYNSKRQLYVNLNTSEKDIEAIVYHIKNDKDFEFSIYSFRTSIQSILFLSRLLFSAEIRYWLIELEIASLVWMFRKIRHMMKSSISSSIIYTDHDASLSIAKQTSLTTFFTDKLNLRLVRAFEYIQKFDLTIRHKSDRLHLVSDALSRLSTANISVTNTFNQNFNNDDELNVLFVASMTKMTSKFKKRLLHEYILNPNWIKIMKVIDSNEKNNISILFIRINDDLIYRKEISDNASPFVLSRMCIPASLVNEILHMIHNEDHFGLDTTTVIPDNWYR